MNHKLDQCREITRHGVVTAVHGSVADIEIDQRSACSSCHVKVLCAAGDATAKTVTAPNDGTLTPGMPVFLSMDERIGWLGVLVGFVAPLVLVVTLLFVLRRFVSREEIAGLIAILALIPYYFGVHLFRGFFERIVRFRVSPRPFYIVRKEGTL